jgi:diguanylate cyclase (GGDEF)-like protein
MLTASGRTLQGGSVFRIVRFRRDKEAAYQAEQTRRLDKLQRWLVLAGGAAYGLAGLWVAVAVGDTTGVLTVAALALLGVTLLLWALTYTAFVRERLEIVPIVVALIFGWHQVFNLAFVPEGGALRAAFLFGSLAAFTTLMAPTAQAALAAIVSALATAALGFVVVFPLQGAAIDPVEALAFGAPLVAIVAGLALALDFARREAFSYKYELARRATTDDISGVSNRPHIYQLAQNEFGRARRYQEPLSVLMIEIDGFDAILENSGPTALDTLVKVFAGYCIIVMRHCDSFGRLGPKRFLALLPETPAKGAMVLARRMCRDLAALDVLADEDTLNFTVSIGAAEAHAKDTWAGDLLRRCTQALDDAIDSGRNTAVLAHLPGQAVANDPAPMMADAAVHLAMPEPPADAAPDERRHSA